MLAFVTLFSTITVFSVLISALLFVVRRRFGKADDSLEYIPPPIFSFFTTLYAFFIGFAIVTLWSAFLKAESNVAQEADCMLMAYRVSYNLPRSEEFRGAVVRYVKSVIEDEWPQMQKDSMSQESSGFFDEVWNRYNRLKPDNKGDNDIYANLNTFLSEAGKYRLSRGLLIKGNLYPPVWMIIVFGFISFLYCLYFTNMQRNLTRIIFEFMVLFVLIACIYFIYDINTPFSGYITVKPDGFLNVYAKMLALN